ncbi:uncharacterized protein SAPINGB_P001186 [Magnusiomyces paraingens]|uniref:Thioesterase domain-containing protein n=1 Tax=Magnusiomyces paraingens TaxID=2606893 RepID=A0A5E8BAQ2_9ASCO|nr:uncharacterized protein SAPINGB_P001186 [Saprochaete ingens]VVT46383.1 unnamed protein product [Saprochaete ingens]
MGAVTTPSYSLISTIAKYFLIVFLIGNYKVLPLKWSLHFYYYVAKYLIIIPRLEKKKNKNNNNNNKEIKHIVEKKNEENNLEDENKSISGQSSSINVSAASSTVSLTPAPQLIPAAQAHTLFSSDHSIRGLYYANEYWSRAVAMECDLNGHKSNSTYFTDLDLARSDLLLDIFRDSFLYYRARDGRYPYVPLGSVACIFKREIKPYQKYVVRSRVLGWDRKWMFVVSRFEFAPSNNNKNNNNNNKGQNNEQRGKLAAVGLSKYVFKLGRKTLPPEEFLSHSKESLGFSEKDIERGRMEFGYAKGMIEAEATLDLEL